MSKKMICPNCEAERLVEPVTEKETVTVRGEDFLVEMKHFRCLECGEFIEDPEHEIDELDLAYREYRAAHQLLQPEAIRELRESLNLTQNELAVVLGWSPATLSRYENGALQEKSHDNLLQLIKDPLQFLSILERAKEQFSPERLATIKQTIEAKLDTGSTFHLIHTMEAKSPDIFSGKRVFSIDQYRSTVQIIIKECGGNLPKTKLNKLLFYTDFTYFANNGTSITGAQYTHERFGPCPQHFQTLLGYLIENGFIEIEEVPTQKGDMAELISLKNANQAITLSKNEISAIVEVCKRLGNKNSAELTDLSHHEKAYTATTHKEPISYEYANYLSIK